MSKISFKEFPTGSGNRAPAPLPAPAPPVYQPAASPAFEPPAAQAAPELASAVPAGPARKGAQELGRVDWEKVLTQHEYTGKPAEIARRAELHVEDVKYLLNKGVPRLEMPPVKDYVVDRHKVELAMQERRAQSRQDYIPAVRAATERTISEAAAAQDLMSSSVGTGVMIGQYIEELGKKLIANQLPMAMPEALTPDFLMALAKISETNAKTMERAVKLVRLTKGMSTENIEGRIVGLLKECSHEELRVAALNGGLPKRLVSRNNGAEPMQDGGGSLGINTKSTVIDVEFEEGNEPSWLQNIASPEGESTDES